MWKRIAGILVITGLITGCGSNQLNDNAFTDGKDENNLRNVTSSQIDENPTTIDLAKGNPSQNIGSDVDKAKYVVKSFGNYQPGAVTINGNNMWVTAQTKDSLTEKERMKKEAKLHKKLIQALPRYDISVKIEEK